MNGHGTGLSVPKILSRRHESQSLESRDCPKDICPCPNCPKNPTPITHTCLRLRLNSENLGIRIEGVDSFSALDRDWEIFADKSKCQIYIYITEVFQESCTIVYIVIQRVSFFRISIRKNVLKNRVK